jgi:hypothetical protein
MPLPVSALLSLPEAVRFLEEATSENENRVRAALREAGLAGAITATGCLHSSSLPDPAKYFAHPALNEREPVPPHEWGTTISWLESRIGRYDLVRLNRADIERWLAAAATNGDEQPREKSPSPRPKKAKKDTKPDAIAKILRGRYDARPPMTNDELAREIEEEAKHIGGFKPRTSNAQSPKHGQSPPTPAKKHSQSPPNTAKCRQSPPWRSLTLGKHSMCNLESVIATEPNGLQWLSMFPRPRPPRLLWKSPIPAPS